MCRIMSNKIEKIVGSGTGVIDGYDLDIVSEEGLAKSSST